MAKQKHDQAGYSLVELVVAAIILGLLIIGMTAMVQKGAELDVRSDHRRQARSLIHATFERPDLNFRMINAIIPGTFIDSVKLDSGETAPVVGILRRVVSKDTLTVSTTKVPRTRIALTLRWPEVEGADSITVEKWISNAD